MVLVVLGIIRIALLVVVCYFALRLFFLLWNFHNEDRIFVPTVHRTLPLLWKYIQKNERLKNTALGSRSQFNHFIDIGGGDGTVVMKAAQLQIAKKVTGVEIQTGLYLWGWLRIMVHRVLQGVLGKKSHITWLRADAEKLSLGEYDCIYLFLAPSSLARLEKKIHEECEPGTVVISWVFPVEMLAPKLVQKLTLPGLKSPKTLHIYRL